MQKLIPMCAHGLATAFLLTAMQARADSPRVDDIPPPAGNAAPADAGGDKSPVVPPAVSPYGQSLDPRLAQGWGGVPAPWAPASGIPGGDALSYALSAPFYGMRPAPQPWKGVFFENDFSFLRDPNHEYVVGERLKDRDVRALTIGQMRIPDLECDDPNNIQIREFLPLAGLPDPTRISYGGEVRFRQMDESNRLRPGAPGRGDYQLWRWRQYLDLKVSDWLRVYVEGIDASMDNNPLPVTGIDVNRWDVQNLFLDLRLWTFDDDDDRPLWFRVGRQELHYGSQRLVSAFDWANVRRNFEGLKLFTRGAEWDFDLWFTRPVNTGTFGDGPVSVFGSHFDSPNMAHTFSGGWFTYKALKDHLFDLYWLWDW
ncbi:MAG: alginate export family protein, partial [Deltaproteobacteria bacterium]